MKDYIYYPGCSLKGNSKHYEESILPVFRELGLTLEELEDWNCCGATAYFSMDDLMATAICGRNLSLAEKKKKNIIAPCAGCYLTLKKAHKVLQGNSDKARKINQALERAGCPYYGSIEVKHPLEVLIEDIGLERIKDRVRFRLKGLKVACYYGCQLVRPFTDFDDPDYPISMDQLIEAVGAQPIPYSAKTRCCGGSLTGTIEEVGKRLNFILLKEAKRRGADAIVTLCPLCQFNLEILQDKMARDYGEDVTMPILYFSQLLGLAFGLAKEDLGFRRSIIDLRPLWQKLSNGGIQ